MNGLLEKHGLLTLQSHTAAVFALDINGSIKYANPAGCKFFNSDLPTLINQDFHSLIHPPGYSIHQPQNCPFVAAVNEGVPLTRELDTFRNLNLDAIWVEYTLIPVKDEGELVGFTVVVYDAPTAYRSLKVFEDVRARFKATFEAAVDPTFILNNRAVIIETNPSAFHYFDQPKLVGHSFFSLFPKENQPQIRHYWHALLQKESHKDTLTINQPGGDIYIFKPLEKQRFNQNNI